MINTQNLNLLEEIKQGNLHLFEQFFKTHYKQMVFFANSLLQDTDEAEEIVQEVFAKLWERKAELTIDTSLKSYVFRWIRNDSLNFIKRKKLDFNYREHNKLTANQTVENNNEVEIQNQIQQALNQLPEKCREVFELSRFEELKYHEIASRLNISVKTVENQMGKALKILRVALKDYLAAYILISFFKNFN